MRELFPVLYEELYSRFGLTKGEEDMLLTDIPDKELAHSRIQAYNAVYVVKHFQKMFDDMIDSSNKSGRKMFWLTLAMVGLTGGLVFVGVVQLFW